MIDPVFDVWKPQTSEMIVDLPEPEAPTSAVTVPAWASKRFREEQACQDVSEGNVLECDIALDRFDGRVRVGSRSSSVSLSISAVRSRPANASVSWVPTLTNWAMGATMKASSMVNST